MTADQIRAILEAAGRGLVDDTKAEGRALLIRSAARLENVVALSGDPGFAAIVESAARDEALDAASVAYTIEQNAAERFRGVLIGVAHALVAAV